MKSETEQEKLKPHEKALKSLVIDERITQFILEILGLESCDTRQLNEIIQTNDKLKKSYFDLFTAEDLLNLPKLAINATTETAQGEWIKDGGRLKISDDEDYENTIDDAISAMFPLENIKVDDEDKRIPLTILLPDGIEMDGDSLIGKKSCWKFITVKNEPSEKQDNIEPKAGLLGLIKDPKSLFGLRLFSVFQSLGLVDHLQTSKKNTLFSNIIQSTGLAEHFTLINSKEIKNWKNAHEILKNSPEKLGKLNDQIADKQDKLERIASEFDTEKIAKLQSKIAELNKKKNEVFEDIINAEKALDKLKASKPDIFANKITQSFYYCKAKPTTKNINFNNAKTTFTLPAFKFAESPEFQANIMEMDGNVPAKRFIERIQFALSYLFSMTSGTAITFLLKPEKTKLRGNKTQGFEAPTIILPKVWNELALGVKQHNPKDKVEDYFGSDDKESVDKSTYTSALYVDFWDKREELLRCIPTGKGLSLLSSVCDNIK